MSVRMSRGLPSLRSGYDQTNPLPPTRKSKPSLSISSTYGSASARRRTSSSSATDRLPQHAHRLSAGTDSAERTDSERHGEEHSRARAPGPAGRLDSEAGAVSA